MKPDDLLGHPRRRLFTPEPGGPGVLLVSLCFVLAVCATLLVAAYAGWVLPDGGLMLALGLLCGVALPALIARRLARRGWRAFAGIEAGLVVLLLFVLGGPTDRALATHGVRPFHALAHLLGQADERDAPVMDVARGVVVGLRRLARRGAPIEVLPRAGAVRVDRVDGGDERGEGRPTGQPASGAVVVDLPVARAGAPIVVGAIVDGHVPADFVFDTGAEVTLITLALARRLGFSFEDTDARRPLRTATGETLAAPFVLHSLRVEDAKVEGLEVLVCEICRENLLGRDFQRHFRVELDAERGRLLLHRR